MALRQPQSTSECVYFTRRTLGDKGKAMAWAYRIDCPKCKKAKMGKPVERGKFKIRAKEYECPACHYSEDKLTHEKRLTLEVIYTCPHCSKSGEATTEYIRRTWEGSKAYVFNCQSCGKKIGITKKMKEKKGDDDD